MISNFGLRIAKSAYEPTSAKIPSPLGNYVTIRRTRHSGSRPDLRDLAGMTNCDTVSRGG